MKAQSALGQMVEHLNRALEADGGLDPAAKEHDGTLAGFVIAAASMESTIVEAQDACATQATL